MRKAVTAVCALLCLAAMLGAAEKGKAGPSPSLNSAQLGSPDAYGYTTPDIYGRAPKPPSGPGMPQTDDSLWIQESTLPLGAPPVGSWMGTKVYGDTIYQMHNRSTSIPYRILKLNRLTGVVFDSIIGHAGEYGVGISKVGDSLYVSLYYASSHMDVYYIPTKTYVRSFSPGFTNRGLDWDGTKFWVVNDAVANAVQIRTMNRAGTTLRTFTGTAYWGFDLTLDRSVPNRLWMCDQTNNQVDYISFDSTSNTYQIRAAFSHPGGAYPEGIGFFGPDLAGGHVYTVSSAGSVIYKMLVHMTPYATDVAAGGVINPGTMMTPNSTCTPSGTIRNPGTASASNIPVRMWIDSAGTRIYNQTVTYAGPLAPNATATVTFPLNWTIGNAGRVYQVTMFTYATLDSNRGNDTVKQNTVSLSPPNRYFEPEWGESDGHTIYSACVVQESLLWVSHGYYAPNRFMIYRLSDLTLVDSFNQTSSGTYSYLDLYYDAPTDVVYGTCMGTANTFYRYNATTHAYLGSNTISPGPGSYTLAITGDGDSLYVSGWYAGIYKCSKTGTNSHLVAPNSPQNSNMGLGCDRINDRMYVTQAYSSGTSHWYEYDMNSWAIILDTLMPNTSSWAGCELYKGDTFFIVARQTDSIKCYRLYPLAQDLGVDAMISPSGIVDTGTYAPVVRIKNFGGGATASSPAILTITGGYVDTMMVPALQPGDTVSLTFADWVATTAGAFSLRCSVALSGDQKERNNFKTGLALIPNFIETFEPSNGAFIADPSSGGWTWGVPVSPRPTPHSGTQLWGGPLTGSYPNNMNWKLNSCQLLALQDNPVVAFYHWYYFESGWDGGNIKYSTNGGATWALLTPSNLGTQYNGVASTANVAIPGEPCFTSGPLTGMQLAAVQVPVTTGTSFLVRWHEGSDGSVTYTGGWTVDDVAGIGCRPAFKDVGVMAITRPNPTEVPGSMVPVQIRAKNYGEIAATFDIRVLIGNILGPDTLLTSRTGLTLAAGAEQMFQMPDLWFPLAGGLYAMRCSTIYAVDQDRSNDTMARTIYTGTLDMAVQSIIAPAGGYDTLAVITPSVRVQNMGEVAVPFRAFFWFDSVGEPTHTYIDSLDVAPIPPDSQQVLTFIDWAFPHPLQSYTTRCSLYAPGDGTPANNVMGGNFVISIGYQNIAVTALVAPTGGMDTHAVVTPSARVRNYGEIPASFPAIFSFTNSIGALVYTQAVTVTGLGVGSETTLVFPDWTFPHDTGTYATTCSTYLAADTTPGDNVRKGEFMVWYFPPEVGWFPKADVPLGPKGKKVKDGFSTGYSEQAPDNFIYALKGNSRLEFYQYNIGANAWATKESIPAMGSLGKKKMVKKGAVLTNSVAGSNRLYAAKGGGTLDWWCYDPSLSGSSTYPWSQKADVPVGAKTVKEGTGEAVVEIGGETYVYFLKGSSTTEFYRYKISTNTWETMANAPTGASGKMFKNGSTITYDGDNTIYTVKATYNEFFAYSVDSNTWTTLTSVPLIGAGGKKKKLKDGSGLAYHNGIVYALKGGNTLEFWKYKADTLGGPIGWTELTSIPVGLKRVKGGGTLVYAPKPYPTLWASKGNNTVEWYKYGLASFVPTASTPNNGAMSGAELGTVTTLSVSPNPFNRLARVSYTLPISGNVSLKLYDVTGKLVSTLHNGHANAGNYTSHIDASTLARGIYLLKLATDDTHTTTKLILE